MPYLYCDLETYSETPINAGTHKYSEDSEIMLFAYALDNEPVKVWDCTADKKMPYELYHHLNNPEIMTVWHNGANFDSIVMKANGLELPIKRIHDTMTQALMHSLPGALGSLCTIFGLDDDEAKDADGKKLIQLFCKPRPKSSKLRRATRETHPKEWARFVSYAGSDIKAMRAIHRKMPAWNCNETELSLFALDQQINRRGVAVDMELAHGAIAAVELEKIRLAERAHTLTDGEVESATKRDKLLRYICESYGIDLPDLTASTLERRMEDPDLPQPLRELLGVRLAASTASVAKYKKLIKCANKDGRLRGLLQFCGAARTGRWAGRLFQPQSLPRPTLKQDEIDRMIEAFKGGWADLVCDNIMEAASSAIRGCIVASHGKKLVITDLSNIEGRVLCWLAGESWKIQAFHDADNGIGHDLYKLAYGRAFNIDAADVTKDMRQIGKVLELSMGYAGGVGAFASMAMAYGMDLDELAAAALPNVPADVRAEAEGLAKYLKGKKSELNGLSHETWIACDSLKRLWRRAHPAIVELWENVEQAAKKAITTKKAQTVNGLVFDMKGAWMRIKLPSGRFLQFPSPRVEDGQITYMGVNPYSRKWQRLKTFGGKLVENIIQAIARDILGHNMPIIEQAGFEIVLSVHDEVITEAPDHESYHVDKLSSLLAFHPSWAQTLPLAAAGFEAYRYRKD